MKKECPYLSGMSRRVRVTIGSLGEVLLVGDDYMISLSKAWWKSYVVGRGQQAHT